VKLSILIGYAPAGDARAKSWPWVEARYRALLPEAELVVGRPDVVGQPGSFNKPLAINRAAALATGDVFLIGDADTTGERESLLTMIEVAERGGWALPWNYVRLDRPISDRWIHGDPAAPPPTNWQRHLEGEVPFANAGLVVLPRAAFEATSGMDERFTGWGGDDDALRASVETLWGEAPRRVGIAYHLWHPRPPAHSTASPNYPAQRVLADRYTGRAGDVEAMRALIAERP
jgi:hypothetical protein